MERLKSILTSGIAAISLTMVVTGCVTAPGTYPIKPGIDDIDLTAESNAIIQNKANEVAYRVAVLPHNASLTNSYVEKYAINKAIGDQVEALFSELTMFELIARGEIDILNVEEVISNFGKANSVVTLPQNADVSIIYSISACNIDSKDFTQYESVKVGNEYRRIPKKVRKHNGYIALKITMLDKETHKKFDYFVSGRSEWDEGGETAQLLTDAIDIALKDFIQRFAYDWARPGIVTQTRGGGLWAQISLGRNDGLRVNNNIEFFTKDKFGNERPLAYGRVRELNNSNSWVHIKDYKDAAVKVNSWAKLSPNQSTSLFDGGFFYNLFTYGAE